MKVAIASSIAFMMGYFVFRFIGDESINGIESIRVNEVMLLVLMFSCFGIVAGIVGVLRNRRNLVEIDLNQIFPYIFAAAGYITAHYLKNGVTQLSDAGIAGVALMVTLSFIGAIKNAILFLHNKISIKKHQSSGNA